MDYEAVNSSPLYTMIILLKLTPIQIFEAPWLLAGSDVIASLTDLSRGRESNPSTGGGLRNLCMVWTILR